MTRLPRPKASSQWFVLRLCAVSAAVFLVAANHAWAADAEPNSEKRAGASTLDDALLDDLDNELLDGVDDLKDGRMPLEPGEKHDHDDAPDAEGQSTIIDDPAAGGQDADPLLRVSQEMRNVEELIPRRASRPHAEQLQELIVDELARLIEQAEQQRAQQSSSKSKQKQEQATRQRQSVQQPKPSAADGGKNSSKPAQDSTNRLGQADAARVDPESFKAMMKDTWGHLPERDREQVLQNSPDKFLPQYELMIEMYFRRLAEDPDSR